MIIISCFKESKLNEFSILKRQCQEFLEPMFSLEYSSKTAVFREIYYFRE